MSRRLQGSNENESRSEEESSSNSQVSFDPDQPAVPQVYAMGDKYEEWVEHPLTGISKDPNRSIVIFGGPFEWFTHVPWWQPWLWCPVAVWLTYKAMIMGEPFDDSWLVFIISPLTYFFGWPFFEYTVHRWVFHLPTLGNGVLNVAHFLLHGAHHVMPRDQSRILAPLPLIAFLSIVTYGVLRVALPVRYAYAVLSGLLYGYIGYDITHHNIHATGSSKKAVARARKLGPWVRDWPTMRRNHMEHHYSCHDRHYGITENAHLVDTLLGTD